MAMAKPSAELCSRPDCKSALGAKAMECTSRSSRPQRACSAANTASI